MCSFPKKNLIVLPWYEKPWHGLNCGEPSRSCASVGIARAALATAVSYAKESEQGKKIGSHQLTLRNDLAQHENHGCRGAHLAHHGHSDTDRIKCEAESSLANIYSTEAAALTTRESAYRRGGYGYSEEYPAERFYRDATMQTIPIYPPRSSS